jgi:hypothetical protein
MSLFVEQTYDLHDNTLTWELWNDTSLLGTLTINQNSSSEFAYQGEFEEDWVAVYLLGFLKDLQIGEKNTSFQELY